MARKIHPHNFPPAGTHFADPRRRSLFGCLFPAFFLLVGLGVATVFVVVLGGMVGTFLYPEQMGAIGGQAVRAADVACTEGCTEPLDPKLCYEACMVNATTTSGGAR